MPLDFNHYYTNDELEAALKNWVDNYPNLVSLSSIGASHEGKPIWLLAVTNSATGNDAQKPAVWVDGNIHATELAGTTAVLFFLDSILNGYGSDERITRLMDNSVLYAVPRINPDGAGAAMNPNPRFLRSGVRPYPWEERDEGLHVQDVDGDGRILQIRIPDPNGDWKPSEKDPQFLVKRAPEDSGGNYYRLLPEGLIDNYDGYLINIARPVAALDFNRNFPFEWRPENEQQGAGPYPVSEPEINAVVRFISLHHNINAALTFHTFSRAVLRPFSTRPDSDMDENDLHVYKQLGEIGTRFTGYRNVSTYHDFIAGPKDITTGAFDDWMYDHFGAFVFTVELWDLPTEAGIKDRKFSDWFIDHPVEDDLRIYDWVMEHAGPEGYVAWYPFDHPQLGKVELGGWDTLYTWRNPPHQYLQKEVEKSLPFLLTMADLLPHLSIHTLEVKRVSEKSWTIDLVVENNGYLPSYTSQQAQKRKAVRPVTAEIRLPQGARIILGKQRMEIGHLEGRSNKQGVVSVFGGSSTDNRGHIQWLIECREGSPIELTVHSERAGEITRKLLVQ